MNPLPPGSIAAGGTPPPTQAPVVLPSTAPSGTPTTAPTSGPSATPADARLTVPSGFHVDAIANVSNARELAALPNGDLLVGTAGATVAIVPNAESAGAAGAAATFATLSEGPAQGVAFGDGFVFVATEHAVWRIPYTNGAQSGTPAQIASLRTGSVAPNSDGDVHHTSSVAVSGSSLYVGVGSSCDACTETDPTRATVQRMGVDGSAMTTQARRFRNAIALATDPATGTVWAGGAGQDYLPSGHPFEFLDPVSSRTAPADYGWPECEENAQVYAGGANCTGAVVPAIAFPAYSTIVGAAFYPAAQNGTYVFPNAWRGGMFVGMHGSWHTQNGVPIDPPHVAFVPFANGAPARAVNWADPTTQWSDILSGFQDSSGARIGRPTGVAVGPQGSLYVADDQTGTIYRIRPLTTAASVRRRR